MKTISSWQRDADEALPGDNEPPLVLGRSTKGAQCFRCERGENGFWGPFFFWKPLRSWAPSVVYWAAGIQWDGDTEPTLPSAISKCHDTDDRRRAFSACRMRTPPPSSQQPSELGWGEALGTRLGKLHKWISTDPPFLMNPTFPPHMGSRRKMPSLVPAPALPHCLPAKPMLHVHISPWPHCTLPLPNSSASPAPPQLPALTQRPSQRALSGAPPNPSRSGSHAAPPTRAQHVEGMQGRLLLFQPHRIPAPGHSHVQMLSGMLCFNSF